MMADFSSVEGESFRLKTTRLHIEFRTAAETAGSKEPGVSPVPDYNDQIGAPGHFSKSRRLKKPGLKFYPGLALIGIRTTVPWYNDKLFGP